MDEQKKEIVIEKHTTQSWLKSALLGFFIGLAVIVPGISGSTVAIIFKLYDKMLHAISNLFKKFIICALFLLPIVIGVIIGFAVGFIGIKQLLEIIPFAIIGLFAGLMIGAFSAVKDELKGAEVNSKRIILLVIGILIPIAIGVVSVLLQDNDVSLRTTGVFDKIEIWEYLLFIILGYIVAITQLVPGLSATAVLMAFGYFKPLMATVSLTYWKENPSVLLLYVCLGVGLLLGIFTFSKLLTYLFKKARHTTYFLIVGLSLGSIVSMFFNPDIYEIYVNWSKGEGNLALDLPLGLVLMGIGIVIAYLFVKYERKKGIESNN